MSWRHYARSPKGFADEETLVQPTVFPKFAESLLGFSVNVNLAPERHAGEGKPDFTPADPITHPFVFETKPTVLGSLERFDSDQIERYLLLGRPRIQRVVLTNLLAIRVFELDNSLQLSEVLYVNLVILLAQKPEDSAALQDASRLAQFLEEYRHRTLTSAEKLQRIRQAPRWNPIVAITNADWISSRLERVVAILQEDVIVQVRRGALESPTQLQAHERSQIVEELRHLEWRLGSEEADIQQHTLADYVSSPLDSEARKALTQYLAHVAYYATTRLMLVRIWEDLELLEPVLYNGGFDHWMGVFKDAITKVVDHSFSEARQIYRALFDQKNSYTWYEPSQGASVDSVYELANTYFGAIESDILGIVYERLLQRIDRKLLGQYYTPRDIISLIWNLIDIDPLMKRAEAEGREMRVLDIATGSGGFLVECARRLIKRFELHRAQGASIDTQSWINRLANGLNGVEIQRFPAYLAELNLLVQLARLLAIEKGLRLPPLAILGTDTLSLHNPVRIFEEEVGIFTNDLLVEDEDRQERALKIKDPEGSGFYFDVACGNPPYVGEKRAAPVLRATRDRFPYWNAFVAPHLDYQYWFLILGLSKLRKNGRFGFITTEYWLRSSGAGPLRGYLASNCRVERLVLFRNLRLFPDAPGQHSLIVVGERITDALSPSKEPAFGPPLVSLYEGPPTSIRERAAILEAVLQGTSKLQLRTFRASTTPNSLGNSSWAEVILNRKQLDQRRNLREGAQLDLKVVKGVETTVNALGPDSDKYLPMSVLRDAGWPQKKTGIYVLERPEVESLYPLNTAEVKVVRLVANTADVFPYATVLPTYAPSIIYLRKQQGSDSGLSDEQVINTAFPTGMSRLERHLQRYQPLLAAKTISRGERRPWWSLHRPRAEIVDTDRSIGEWGDYCLTTRWGSGGKFIVGLAPRGCVPSSSLHMLMVEGALVSAAYLTALFNSTIFQMLADALPPGQLRKDDLKKLGLPYLKGVAADLEDHGLRLASIVVALVRDLAPRFPLVTQALKRDIDMNGDYSSAWIPDSGPTTSWGPLTGIKWCKSLTTKGNQNQKIAGASESHDLFGTSAIVNGANGASLTIEFQGDEPEVRRSFVAVAQGLITESRTLKDIAALHLPINPSDLPSLLLRDKDVLDAKLAQYRSLRAEVDRLVEQGLALH